mgnify:CR=1 FL=1
MDRIFQFPLVRLKVMKRLMNQLDNGISIPFGAIKSKKIDRIFICPACISIPFGAIKSSSAERQSGPAGHFNSLWCD